MGKGRWVLRSRGHLGVKVPGELRHVSGKGWSEKVDHRQDPVLPRMGGIPAPWMRRQFGCWFEFLALGQVQFEEQTTVGWCLTTDLVLGSAWPVTQLDLGRVTALLSLPTVSGSGSKNILQV